MNRQSIKKKLAQVLRAASKNKGKLPNAVYIDAGLQPKVDRKWDGSVS